MKSFFMRRAEKWNDIWVKRCTEFDAPRLASETYPADVKTDGNVIWSGEPLNLALDYYRPFNVDSSKECFLLIHGGAFTYGYKELDKCFGMHLAKYSGIPVANMDYTLMPKAGLSEIMCQITTCMNFLTAKYGIEKFHLTGDSAGGYLALMSALAARNSHLAHELWIFEKLKGEVVSASPICGGFRYHPKGFPGIFFEKRQDAASGNKQRLPKYVYDVMGIIGRDSGLKIALITGEDDDMRNDNLEALKNIEGALFYDAKNEGDLHMHHVFPIAHPEWPQSQKVMELITFNATRRN